VTAVAPMAWEYLTEKCLAGGLLGGKVDLEELRSRLNHLGQFGWELVSALDTNQAPYGETREIVLILKRPKPAP